MNTIIYDTRIRLGYFYFLPAQCGSVTSPYLERVRVAWLTGMPDFTGAAVLSDDRLLSSVGLVVLLVTGDYFVGALLRGG
ncbi:hypothetical protein AALO_G00097740 [Alosa alosa]|uniref:Uncharacterized protein n=1 Tax=Alosa alosa TaxID=278164 RepID=A0AAV6GWR4_9TELE|nr:hypothetical protein AALO_G00097740 [Alosa alosa]